MANYIYCPITRDTCDRERCTFWDSREGYCTMTYFVSSVPDFIKQIADTLEFMDDREAGRLD